MVWSCNISLFSCLCGKILIPSQDVAAVSCNAAPYNLSDADPFNSTVVQIGATPPARLQSWTYRLNLQGKVGNPAIKTVRHTPCCTWNASRSISIVSKTNRRIKTCWRSKRGEISLRFIISYLKHFQIQHLLDLVDPRLADLRLKGPNFAAGLLDRYRTGR